MNKASKQIQRTYVLLMLGNTLAASFIWGINTIFLLDAGLSNFEAFATNAFFTVGMVLFEVPTGVVADIKGRRLSYLLGSFTLVIATLLYLLMWYVGAPFLLWAFISVLLGLGFTFFSGATEAWLVDALKASGYTKDMESVFAKGQIASGIAMLVGSVGGGVIAQLTNLGVPYVLRSVLLAITIIIAFRFMHDIGFEPDKTQKPTTAVRRLLKESFEHGLKSRPVRWLMLAAPFTGGVSIYVFYALQPYLLELYGDPAAYGIAGLAAAIVALSQIIGGIMAPKLRRLFTRRTSFLLFGVILTVTTLILTATIKSFAIVLLLQVIGGLVFAAMMPVRQALLNGLIPSKQRATVLSFDSLMSSSGGVVFQPVLGRSADVYGYATSYAIAAAFQAMSVPFLLKAKTEHTNADLMVISPVKNSADE